MTFTITKQDRICEEANACVGHQWILNDKWVFARLREVFEFITERWPE